MAIPLYDKERYIARAVRSVLSQTMREFEVVVVDDGSKDDGAAIVAGIDDSRVRLIRQANEGEGVARQRAIHESRGVRIAFLDADDEWLPWFLERALELEERYPSAGLFALAVATYPGDLQADSIRRGPPPPAQGELLADYFASASRGRVLSSSTVMMPRRVFDDVAPRLSSLAMGADQFLWCQVALRHRVAFDASLGAWYHEEASGRASATHARLPRLAFVELLEEVLARGAPSHLDERTIRAFIARQQLFMIGRYLRGRGSPAGLHQLLREVQPTRDTWPRWLRYWLRGYGLGSGDPGAS